MTERKFKDITFSSESGSRKVRTTLELWKDCPHRRCRRARACVGDGARGLPCCASLSGEEETWLAEVSRVHNGGAAMEDAFIAGALAVKRYRRDEEMRTLLRDAAALVRRTARQQRLARTGK